MKRTMSLMALGLVLALSGCAKSKREPSLATGKMPAADRAKGATVPSTSATARDDMKAILLELQRVHFAFDSTALLPDAREALQRAGELLVKHPEVALYIDGHADLRGTTEYNLALGDRRARAVIDYLTRLGVPEDRLSAVTFGAERPRRDATDDAAHAENRRVEFRLMRGDVELVLRDGTPFDDAGRPLSSPVASADR